MPPLQPFTTAASSPGEPTALPRLFFTLFAILAGPIRCYDARCSSESIETDVISRTEEIFTLNVCPAKSSFYSGQFVFVEHVKPPSPVLAAVFSLVQPAHALFGDGCQLCRTTQVTVAGAAPWAAVRAEVHALPETGTWAFVRVPWAFGVASKKA